MFNTTTNCLQTGRLCKQLYLQTNLCWGSLDAIILLSAITDHGGILSVLWFLCRDVRSLPPLKHWIESGSTCFIIKSVDCHKNLNTPCLIKLTNQWTLLEYPASQFVCGLEWNVRVLVYMHFGYRNGPWSTHLTRMTCKVHACDTLESATFGWHVPQHLAMRFKIPNCADSWLRMLSIKPVPFLPLIILLYVWPMQY